MTEKPKSLKSWLCWLVEFLPGSIPAPKAHVFRCEHASAFSQLVREMARVVGWPVGRNGTSPSVALLQHSSDPMPTPSSPWGTETSFCSWGMTLSCCRPPPLRPATERGLSEVEIISQQVDEETKSIAPVQLVNFAYRDLPLAAVDLSTAGSQLLSNLDEDYQREG